MPRLAQALIVFTILSCAAPAAAESSIIFLGDPASSGSEGPQSGTVEGVEGELAKRRLYSGSGQNVPRLMVPTDKRGVVGYNEVSSTTGQRRTTVVRGYVDKNGRAVRPYARSKRK